jgi:hypothetical protein
MKFEELFISENTPYKGLSQRDKFLSRVFGIFSEEIIRIWCKNEKSAFVDCGRPLLHDTDGKNYALDFLLKDKEGLNFIAEMKCEIEYQKYKYLTLNSAEQLKHHNKRAFQMLTEIAQSPSKYRVTRNGEPIVVSGACLVWGDATDDGIAKVRQHFGFSHIISVESIINDLISWQDTNYAEFIANYRRWNEELFNGLLGAASSNYAIKGTSV